ncbi:hypothetical protein ACE6H2_001267 [Prunus campanulata]
MTPRIYTGSAYVKPTSNSKTAKNSTSISKRDYNQRRLTLSPLIEITESNSHSPNPKYTQVTLKLTTHKSQEHRNCSCSLGKNTLRTIQINKPPTNTRNK